MITARSGHGKRGQMSEVILRPMTADDYEAVQELWLSIRGFAIRSIDDSREEILRFLKRNPGTSVVALEGERIVGSILCGNDGRQGSFYHVCVAADRRRRGIGTRMAAFCMEALRKQKINKISLIAFSTNDGGNAFWKQIGWTCRSDCNYYEFVLNKENITRFISGDPAAQ
ncbi:MAG: GNAT family N-acetyltransferase [Lachnospiraceae bacterium]|nr:GNAT family N-acetyltransferase [Lachnospiraceae bacterium]